MATSLDKIDFSPLDEIIKREGIDQNPEYIAKMKQINETFDEWERIFAKERKKEINNQNQLTKHSQKKSGKTINGKSKASKSKTL